MKSIKSRLNQGGLVIVNMDNLHCLHFKMRNPSQLSLMKIHEMPFIINRHPRLIKTGTAEWLRLGKRWQKRKSTLDLHWNYKYPLSTFPPLPFFLCRWSPTSTFVASIVEGVNSVLFRFAMNSICQSFPFHCVDCKKHYSSVYSNHAGI